MNPLIVYWTDRDLYAVRQELARIGYIDQLHINYFDYPYPHRIAENYFKAHKEYTHLFLIPNDLVVKSENVSKLIRLIEKHDFEVCCGVCNVDLDRNWDYWNVTSNLPDLSYDTRIYKWISKMRYPEMIIQVPFAGFPLMSVRRDVLDKTRLNWLSPQMKGKNKAIWEERGGYSNDLAFAYNLKELGIKINCDTSNQILHLRFAGESMKGKKPPRVEFIKKRLELLI